MAADGEVILAREGDAAVTDDQEEPGAAPVRRVRPWHRVGVVVASAVVVTATAGGGALAVARGQDLRADTSRAPSEPRDAWDFAASDAGPGAESGTGPAYGSGSSGRARAVRRATASQSVGLVEVTSSLVDGQAAGTGLIWSTGGIVVTNHHVVEGAKSVRVTVVSTGRTYTATYVGADAAADVAVLRLDGASGLQPVEPAGRARTGDPVTAVGDANGDGGALTAATGEVLATGRDIVVEDDRGGRTPRSDLIQISAEVVPGDSGGAVLDTRGGVVAMTVAAATGGLDVAGYAIPIEQVRSVVAQVLSGRATARVDLGYHGYLGVALDPGATVPLVVRTISGGAAARAGISAGDTVTAVGRATVSSAEELRAVLGATAPGSWVQVSWRSANGATRTATVLLGRAPID